MLAHTSTSCSALDVSVVVIVRRYIFSVVVKSTAAHASVHGASNLPCTATTRTASSSVSIEIASTAHAHECTTPPQLTAWRDVSSTVPFEFSASPGRSTLVPSNSSWELVGGALTDRNLAFVRGAIAENSTSKGCLNDSGIVLAFWNVRPATFSTGFDDSEDYTIGPWSDKHAKEPWTEIVLSSDDIISTLLKLGLLGETTHGVPASVGIDLLCKLHLEIVFFGQAALEEGIAGGNAYVQVRSVEVLPFPTSGAGESEHNFFLNVTYRRMDAAAHTATPALRRFHVLGAVGAEATAGTSPVDNLPVLLEERMAYSLFVTALLLVVVCVNTHQFVPLI